MIDSITTHYLNLTTIHFWKIELLRNDFFAYVQIVIVHKLVNWL
jgi:hypothetical protein